MLLILTRLQPQSGGDDSEPSRLSCPLIRAVVGRTRQESLRRYSRGARRIAGRGGSPTFSSTPGFRVQKMDCFHCQIQFPADGTPDDIEAPAPQNTTCGARLSTPIERTNSSISKQVTFTSATLFLAVYFFICSDRGDCPGLVLHR